MKRQWIIIGTMVFGLALTWATGCNNAGLASTSPGALSPQAITATGSVTDEAVRFAVRDSGEPFIPGAEPLARPVSKSVIASRDTGPVTDNTTRLVIGVSGEPFIPGTTEERPSLTPVMTASTGTETKGACLIWFIIRENGEPFTP